MIITYPNKILRKKSNLVTLDEVKNGDIKKLLKQMRANLTEKKGIGLAAVQIGVHKKVILVEVDEGEVNPYINPIIKRKSLKKIAIEEGCLSVPGRSGYVKRSETIWLEALDETGKKLKLKVTGLPAIVFQHEIDHTNGILFIDKIIKKPKKYKL